MHKNHIDHIIQIHTQKSIQNKTSTTHELAKHILEINSIIPQGIIQDYETHITYLKSRIEYLEEQLKKQELYIQKHMDMEYN
jgi:hypothetical protein